ncbi:pyruvate formate lyase activating enzyme [Paucidesulfovibrio gracilis DSM 16080]|uniref:Pyruvate formate lyase activating enzyme n=1 Tax=Paucidesulfovibrio gracilis DSM 16080 TaxID=1121449 RepID=A0A1T4W4X8_9BACT|nr:AmmeMemoRadiSam system radical SAM enzyme [Paucidesulfovibrio gracilis]SKA72320.1 pyruvate formate lyase activating enzyme [Paucidesulfovibrio gracilis DSM 16080]
MLEARLWQPLNDDRVQCRLCRRMCVIAPGERGYCGVRENRDGILYSLVYDRLAALNLDPVEKKPLYHFLPGSQTFSFGTAGCNFSCAFCQNDSLSQLPRQGGTIPGRVAGPAELVDAALRNQATSIAYTYSEPTIYFELMRDTATLAKEQGLRNILVSNGYQGPECLEKLGPLIHAANIDLKAFTDTFYKDLCGARLAPVLENLRIMREMGWWLEITTLVIPGWNDEQAELMSLAGCIAETLGKDTPWHVSRFHPQFRLMDTQPTPLPTLERALRAGHEAGLRYVYIGNVPGHEANHTFCPGCGERLVERLGFGVRDYRIGDGHCPDCGHPIAGVWN